MAFPWGNWAHNRTQSSWFGWKQLGSSFIKTIEDFPYFPGPRKDWDIRREVMW